MFVVLTVALFMTAYIRQTLIRHLFALVMLARRCSSTSIRK